MNMKVKSNIKGGVDCELGAKTLILGASGSGKSAIVNSIELAVTRRLGDLLAREDVSRKDLLACYTSDGAPPFAEVKPLSPDASLPFRELKEAIRGSPETLWRYVLKCPADETVKKQLKHSKTRLDEAQSALEYMGRAQPRVAALGAVALWLRLIRADVQMLKADVLQHEESLDQSTRELCPLAFEFAPTWARKAAAFVPESLGAVAISVLASEKLDFKVGLKRSKEAAPRFALSGAEWNIVTTALAIALNDAPSAIVIPDDRAISSLTLTQWLAKLAAAKCQVVVTSTVKPKEPVKGFVLLEL